MLAGCDQRTDAPGKADEREASAKQPDENPTPDSASSTATHRPPNRAPATTKDPNGTTLELEGLSMEVPTRWVMQPVTAGGPMAPVAILQIPNDSGEPGSVRITHFPSMKGMNEPNIQRWLMQAHKADGTGISRDDAKITDTEVGPVHLTTVDIAGTIKATMGDVAKPNRRMIASIVDHARGPHFVVAIGDATLIGESQPAIMAFLESATQTP
jgi:hypothetical protein